MTNRRSNHVYHNGVVVRSYVTDGDGRTKVINYGIQKEDSLASLGWITQAEDCNGVGAPGWWDKCPLCGTDHGTGSETKEQGGTPEGEQEPSDHTQEQED